MIEPPMESSHTHSIEEEQYDDKADLFPEFNPSINNQNNGFNIQPVQDTPASGLFKSLLIHSEESTTGK